MTNHELRNLHTAGIITTNEHAVLELQLRGLSERTIALDLNLSRSAVRSRLENSHRKIRLHLQSTETA